MKTKGNKHLSAEEKLNANDLRLKNKQRIKELREELRKARCQCKDDEYINKARQEIAELHKKNYKLKQFISRQKRSTYSGMFEVYGECYKMFGKKRKELTPEEQTIYNSYMKAKARYMNRSTPKIYDMGEFGKVATKYGYSPNGNGYVKRIERSNKTIYIDGRGYFECICAKDGEEYEETKISRIIKDIDDYVEWV